MTVTIATVSERLSVPNHHIVRMLKSLATGIFTKLHTSSEASRKTEEAIEILRNGHSSPDNRDWAERYLCGLVDADSTLYFERRRWQS